MNQRPAWLTDDILAALAELEERLTEELAACRQVAAPPGMDVWPPAALVQSKIDIMWTRKRLAGWYDLGREEAAP
jgi:hypothetical protein